MAYLNWWLFCLPHTGNILGGATPLLHIRKWSNTLSKKKPITFWDIYFFNFRKKVQVILQFLLALHWKGTFENIFVMFIFQDNYVTKCHLVLLNSFWHEFLPKNDMAATVTVARLLVFNIVLRKNLAAQMGDRRIKYGQIHWVYVTQEQKSQVGAEILFYSLP